MKIKEKDGTIVNIFAIYWFGDETYFYGLPKGHGGLLAYRIENVTILDENLSGSFVFFKNGIFYKPLISEALLDDLLGNDETAYNRFLEIIKSEGLVEPDFY